jgi:hypothetical protein
MKYVKDWRAACALVALACVAAPMHAMEPGAGVEKTPTDDLRLIAGYAWSDNLARRAVDPEHDSFSLVGLNAKLLMDRPRLRMSLDSNIVYEHYFGRDFDDGFVGGVVADAGIRLIPERLDWVAQNTFGQTRVDPFSAVTAANRENVNFFTTGPDVHLPFGSRSRLDLSARYDRTDYQSTELDNHRYGGTASIVRELGAHSDLSLNATGDRTEFTDAAYLPYNYRAAYLRYEIEGRRTKISSELGYGQVTAGNQRSRGMVARLAVARTISRHMSMSLDAGSQFGDAGRFLNRTYVQQQGQPSETNLLNTADPAESRYVQLGWAVAGRRTTGGLSAAYTRDRYERTVLFDRNITSLGANLRRNLTSRWDVRLDLNRTRESFLNAGVKNQELRAGVSTGWRFGGATEARLQYERFERDRSVFDPGYQENRITLFVSYQPRALPKR